MDEPKELEVVNIDRLTAALEQGSLTEAKIKFETPGARQARETRETAAAAFERLQTLLKLGLTGVLLLSFSGFGLYVLFLKPSATEVQRLSATTVLTAIVSGSAGYAFGKKQDPPDKE